MKSVNKKLIILGIILLGIILIVLFFIIPKPKNQLASKQKVNRGYDTARYFLSKVELIKNRYTPHLIKCLSDKNGKEIYRQWSAIYYPAYPPYKVSLVRVVFNKKTSLNSTCFIKEIKNKKDWQEVEKYKFYKNKFGK